MAKSWKNTLRYGAASIAVATASAMGPACAAEPVQFDIEAAPLGDALRAFGMQAGLSVLFSEALVSDYAAPEIKGSYEPDEALGQLLAGSNLEFIEGPNDNLIIRRRKAAPIKTSAQLTTSDQEPAEEPAVDALNDEPDAVRSEANEPELRAERVTVTGTSIKGIAPDSSPLDIYTRDKILGSGVTTTEQFIRTLPQNFKGGSSELVPVGLPSDANASSNFTYGTAANLRGLGAGGTLVLLNGHRLAPTSAIGDFVDLSLIPVSALDRVDVLTDGASSIYGGDAIAGVINFVLREDFEGAETAVRYGDVTEGEMAEYRVSQTVGSAWGSGNVLGVYEYFDRENLTLADRSDIRPPSLNNGNPIDDLDSFDLLPKQDRHSAVLAFNQNLSTDLRVSASGLYSKRSVDGSSVNSSGSGVLVNTGSESEAITLIAGAQYDFNPDWSIDLDATYSSLRSNQSRRTSTSTTVSSFESESDVWAADMRLNGALFSLPGGEVRIATGGQFRNETFNYLNERTSELIREADRDVSAVYAEIFIPLVGDRNAITGVERLELNVSGRVDDYSDFGSASNPKIGLLWAPNRELRLRTSYSESFSPPPLGRVGDRQSTANVLPTSLITGALGIPGQYPTLDPTDYMIVVGVASDLKPETSKTFTVGADFDRIRGPHSWSASANYYNISFEDRLGRTPIPGNLDPAFAPFLIFDDPASFPPGTAFFFPTADELNAIVSRFDLPPNLLAGATLANVGVINNANIIRNLARTKTDGLDLSIDYNLDTDFGRVSAGFNANYIIDFTQQASVSTAEVDILNTLYNPVDLQLRGNLGLIYDQLSTSLFVNYTDSYKTDSTPTGRKVSSWLTVDVVIGYSFDAPNESLFNDVDLNLSITNIFNAMPPTTSSIGRFQIAGFDPANASPLGRFIALEIRKSF